MKRLLLLLSFFSLISDIIAQDDLYSDTAKIQSVKTQKNIGFSIGGSINIGEDHLAVNIPMLNDKYIPLFKIEASQVIIPAKVLSPKSSRYALRLGLAYKFVRRVYEESNTQYYKSYSEKDFMLQLYTKWRKSASYIGCGVYIFKPKFGSSTEDFRESNLLLSFGINMFLFQNLSFSACVDFPFPLKNGDLIMPSSTLGIGLNLHF